MPLVKFDIGDGRLRSLASALRTLNRTLDRTYEQGLSDNNTISDKNLTSLQNRANTFQQELANRIDETQGELESASLHGNLKLVKKVARQMQRLVKAQDEFNQFFYESGKYQQVNNYKVSSSRAFRRDIDNSDIQEFAHDLSDLRSEIGNYANRGRILNRRWDTSAKTGVMTYERYQQYQQSYDSIQNQFDGTQDQLDQLKQRYQDMLSSYQSERDELSNKINSGNYDNADVKRRSVLDEKIINLKKYNQKVVESSVLLGRVNDDMNSVHGKIEGAKEKGSGIDILSPANSFFGILRTHREMLVRSGIVTGVAQAHRLISNGNNDILNTFDDIKTTSYQQNGNDNNVRNQLFNNSVDADLETSARYLGAFTGNNARNERLSDDDISGLVNAWGGLALYSGGTDQDALQLEQIATSTNTKGMKVTASEKLANSIQNALHNSRMSSKASEQMQALGQMYQVGARSGNFTTQDQQLMAGFQAAMAQHGSDMQGAQGAQAYSAISSSLSNTANPMAQLLFGGASPQYQSPHGHAQLIKDMQKAQSEPWRYKTAIGNMFKIASRASSNKQDQIEMVAGNLVEISGGQLTFDQAEKYAKMYKNGEFDKKHLKKLTKGNGKGNQKQYNKTGGKSLKQWQKAVNKSEIKAAHALNHFTRKLTWIMNTSWITSLASKTVASAIPIVGRSILGNLFYRHGKSVLSKSTAKATEKATTRTARNASRHTHGKAGLVAGAIAGGLALANNSSSGKIVKNHPFRTAPFSKEGRKNLRKELGAPNAEVGKHPFGTAPIISKGSNKDLKHPFSGGTPKNAKKAYLLGSTTGKSSKSNPWNLRKSSKQSSNFATEHPFSTAPILDKNSKNIFKNQFSKKIPKNASKAYLLGTIGSGQAKQVGKSHSVKGRGKEVSKHRLTHVGNVDKLNAKTRRKHKTLIKREWSLIRYLNDFWDIWLRHIKESGGGDSSDNSGDDGGSPSDPDGAISKEEFTKLAKKAAKIMHQTLSQHDIDRLYHQAFTESGVNPAQGGGYDDHDGTGLPVGLFQFKQSTWQAAQRNMPKGHNNIHSALDQIIAVLADKTWRSDIEELGEKRGWTPHGYALGGVVTHAIGGVFDQNTNSQTSQLSPDLMAQADMRSVFYRSRAHRSNYIKSVKRNKATFKVSIDTSQAQIFNKQDIINRVINDEFSAWLTQKQQQKLLDYYSNETSSQFV